MVCPLTLIDVHLVAVVFEFYYYIIIILHDSQLKEFMERKYPSEG